MHVCMRVYSRSLFQKAPSYLDDVAENATQSNLERRNDVKRPVPGLNKPRAMYGCQMWHVDLIYMQLTCDPLK